MRPNLEHDIIRNQKLCELLQNREIAVKLYSSLCNIRWFKEEQEWACSWRYAGEVVANIRNQGEDYMDFYCSGNEGTVDPLIAEELVKLGWTWKYWDD